MEYGRYRVTKLGSIFEFDQSSEGGEGDNSRSVFLVFRFNFRVPRVKIVHVLDKILVELREVRLN